MRSFVKPGILFLLPAMLVLTVFFFLPILAAFVLSLTDFDIYALANTSNSRWVGLSNYRPAVERSAVLAGTRQHVLFRGSWRAADAGDVAVHCRAHRFQIDAHEDRLANDLFRPGGDDARRGRRGVAIFVSHALRDA